MASQAKSALKSAIQIKVIRHRKGRKGERGRPKGQSVLRGRIRMVGGVAGRIVVVGKSMEVRCQYRLVKIFSLLAWHLVGHMW